MYKVIGRYRNPHAKISSELTLIEAYPKTGRTHQIRVHMQYAGFPLFADPLYAGRKQSRDDRKYLSRHFLHASKIKFANPLTGEIMELDSNLPPELTQVLDTFVLQS